MSTAKQTPAVEIENRFIYPEDVIGLNHSQLSELIAALFVHLKLKAVVFNNENTHNLDAYEVVDSTWPLPKENNMTELVAPRLPSIYLWISQRGKFLTVEESTTHTGFHCRGRFTDNIDLAYIGTSLPAKLDLNSADAKTAIQELVPVSAWSERKVYIGVRPTI